MSNLLKRKQLRGSDNLNTPAEVLNYLLPYLRKKWRIWECAAGKGNIVNALTDLGYDVIPTDVLTGQDFTNDTMYEPFDCIITNPPYSKKDEFLARCYELGKPFALLLPLTALEGMKRQALYQKYGVEIVLLPKRIDFTGKKAPWFATAWFTNGLNIGRQLTFNPNPQNNK